MKVPLLVEPAYAVGWQTLAGDPAPSLGLPATADEADDDTLALRGRVLADVPGSTTTPVPHASSGDGGYLADVDGRVYLDMVNNVASVGHAHPRVVEAANRQMRLLNTNSRFNYRVIAEYADRISATLPDELDTVFFVNSGSEATDLAIRIAMAATDRTDIVAMREAYHGWTYASDAVSTSIADNPNALATRPSWVHTVGAATPIAACTVVPTPPATHPRPCRSSTTWRPRDRFPPSSSAGLLRQRRWGRATRRLSRA